MLPLSPELLAFIQTIRRETQAEVDRKKSGWGGIGRQGVGVAVRNIFLGDSGGDGSVTALQARGTVFWQCNVALGAIAQELAQASQIPVADVRRELVAGLNPGVHLVPAHVMALGIAQEHGFTYMKT